MPRFTWNPELKWAMLAVSLLLPCAGWAAGQSEPEASPSSRETEAMARGWRPALPEEATEYGGSVNPGQMVHILLSSGQEIEAEVLAVEPTYLYLDIWKTSAPKTYRQGPTCIPKGTIAQLTLSMFRGPAESSKPDFKSGLRRTGVVTGQVLLVLACVAGVATAIAAPSQGNDPAALCSFTLGLASELQKYADSARPGTSTGPKVAPAGRPKPAPAEDTAAASTSPTKEETRKPSPSCPPYHSASLRGPLFR